MRPSPIPPHPLIFSLGNGGGPLERGAQKDTSLGVRVVGPRDIEVLGVTAGIMYMFFFVMRGGLEKKRMGRQKIL